MQLKKIIIKGFKSFPEKTTLEFNEGVTAIVGPNGSGKSNIIEAIRWVMGEQSAKTLRGTRMNDIIFSGTNKRKPLNSPSNAFGKFIRDKWIEQIPFSNSNLDIPPIKEFWFVRL